MTEAQKEILRDIDKLFKLGKPSKVFVSDGPTMVSAAFNDSKEGGEAGDESEG